MTDVALDPAAVHRFVVASQAVAAGLRTLHDELAGERASLVERAVVAPPGTGSLTIRPIAHRIAATAMWAETRRSAAIAADRWWPGPGLGARIVGSRAPGNGWTGSDVATIVALAVERDRLTADRASGGAVDRLAARRALPTIEAGIAAIAARLDPAGWRAVADELAGFDRATWAPERGLRHNDANVRAIYTFYSDAHLADPRLQWAGLAGLAGRLLYANWIDLYTLRHVLDDRGSVAYAFELADLPTPGPIESLLAAIMPGPAPRVASLTAAEGRWLETQMLLMAQHVFDDLGWMHAAFLVGGLSAVTGAVGRGSSPGSNDGDDELIAAWHDVVAEDPERRARGAAALLRREQYEIIQPDWERIADRGPGDVVGGAVSGYLLAAENPVPGGRPFREVVTDVTEREVPWPRPPIVLPFGSYVPPQSRPIEHPSGDMTSADDRWRWIENDMLPAYLALADERPEELAAILAAPIEPGDPHVQRLRMLPLLPYPNPAN